MPPETTNDDLELLRRREEELDPDMTPLCTIRALTVFWRDECGRWRIRSFEANVAGELEAACAFAESKRTIVVASDVVVPACVELDVRVGDATDPDLDSSCGE